MSGHHKHVKPKDGQRGAATDRKDQDTLTTTAPIFNTLKKGDAFVWTIESEEAFLRLKVTLATPPPDIDKANTQDPPRNIHLGSGRSNEHSDGIGKGGKAVPHILYKMKVPENRKGGPHPSHRISKAMHVFPRALDNREDEFADKTSTQKARPGEQDGSMERPTF
ncbi:hypothetical protein CR513_32732, partial [Mucuna pruriens]